MAFIYLALIQTIFYLHLKARPLILFLHIGRLNSNAPLSLRENTSNQKARMRNLRALLEPFIKSLPWRGFPTMTFGLELFIYVDDVWHGSKKFGVILD